MKKVFKNITIDIDKTINSKRCNIITFQEELFDVNQCNALSKQFEKLSFLSCRHKFKDENVDIYYFIDELISLNQYFRNNKLSKTELKSILKTLCQSIKQCDNYIYFRENNLIIDGDLIYIDPKYKNIYMLYVPSKQIVTKDIIGDFNNVIIDWLNNKINLEEQSSRFTQELLDKLRYEKLSIDNFYKLIENDIQDTYRNSAEIKPNISNINNEIVVRNNQLPTYVERTETRNESKKRGLFSGFKNLFSSKTSTPNNKEYNEINVMNSNIYDEDTVLLQLDNQCVGQLTGNNEGNIENIKINKDQFIIGRLPQVSDYQIVNKTVGKTHAKFIRVDGCFYLVDLESKNGTYLNNEKLIPNSAYLVQDGSTIVFSNCKYTFRIVG